MAPVPVPGSEPAKEAAAADAFVLPVRDANYSFNDDLPSSSPSGKTMLVILASVVGFMVFVVLVVEFRSTLGF